MRCLSSIFSFDALRLPCRAPKAALLALAILIALEATARVAIRAGKIERDPSLNTLIEEHRRDIQTNAYDVWMFGNSMLEWGIDPIEFHRLTGKRAAILTHGNATPRASVALLRHYLESTSRRPKSVMLFFAEDDTNRNGYRADESQRYLDYVSNKEKPKFYERIGIFIARENLCAALLKPVGGLPELPVWRKRSRTGDEQYDPSGAGATPGTDEIAVSAYAQKLLKNFKLDHGVIADFQKTAKRFKIKNIAVVIVPTTDVNAKRHDKLSPSLTCAQIRTRIADICAQRNIPFMNPGEPSTHYQNFRDAYHLNNTGRQRYTSVVAAWYLSRSSDPARRQFLTTSAAVTAVCALGATRPSTRDATTFLPLAGSKDAARGLEGCGSYQGLARISASSLSRSGGSSATFCIEFPVMIVHPPAPHPHAETRREHPRGITLTAPAADHLSLDGITVLAVDDERDARNLIKRVLEDCGARVILAASAEEALMLVSSQRPDMILSDIGMPGEDGYEFIRKVRQLSTEDGGRTPAAGLTAFARAEDRTRALRAGYQTHVAKPVEPTELTAVVASLATRR